MSFIIQSSDGWNRMEIALGDRFADAGDLLVVAEVVVEGDFWDRRALALKSGESSQARDFEVRLPQVLLRHAALVDFANYLEEWLRRPFEGTSRLTASPHTTFDLAVGVHEDLISSPEKPVVAATYRSLRFSGEWRWVVDETCIRAAHDQLCREVAG